MEGIEEMSLRALVMVLAVSATTTASAQEWPRFRGANGAGVSASVVPTRWNADDYRWQVKLPGPGHSSPVAWGDRLFVTSSDDKGNLHVLCLNAPSGRTVWSREFAVGAPRGHKDNNIASATPAIDAKNVYVAWSSPK
jgi:outer membrane protein assembly factor BamB